MELFFTPGPMHRQEVRSCFGSVYDAPFPDQSSDINRPRLLF